MRGFNVGVTISLGDMELALDYINDEDKFMPDIEKYKSERLNSSRIEYTEDVMDTIINDDNNNGTHNKNIAEDKECIENSDDSDDYFEDDDDYFRDDDDYFRDDDDGEYSEDDDGEYSEDDTSEDDYYGDSNTDEYSEDNNEEKEYFEEDTKNGSDSNIINTLVDVEDVKHTIKVNKVNREGNKGKHEDLGEGAEDIVPKEGKNRKTDRAIYIEQRLKEVESKGNYTDIDTEVKVKDAIKIEDSAYRINYDSMDIEALYTEVKKYMQEMGVGKRPIVRKQLENAFGVRNIRKLLMKSYLISLGNTITMGR